MMPCAETPGLPDAVFFDFDGVIADTEPLHYAAFREALSPEGLAFSREEYDAHYIGFDDRDAIETAFRTAGRALSGERWDVLMQAKAAAFVRLAREAPLEPLPGVVGLIQGLCRLAVPLALCSGALPCDIDPILDRFGLSEVFPVRVTARDVERSKPDPASYRLAIRRLSRHVGNDLARRRCLAIEDTPAGIASARAAGLRVLAVATSCPVAALGEADGIVAGLDKVTPNDLSGYLE